MIFSIEVRFVSVGKIRMIRSAPGMYTVVWCVQTSRTSVRRCRWVLVDVIARGSPGAKVAGEMFSSPTNPEGLPVRPYVHGRPQQHRGYWGRCTQQIL